MVEEDACRGVIGGVRCEYDQSTLFMYIILKELVNMVSHKIKILSLN